MLFVTPKLKSLRCQLCYQSIQEQDYYYGLALFAAMSVYVMSHCNLDWEDVTSVASLVVTALLLESIEEERFG